LLLLLLKNSYGAVATLYVRSRLVSTIRIASKKVLPKGDRLPQK